MKPEGMDKESLFSKRAEIDGFPLGVGYHNLLDSSHYGFSKRKRKSKKNGEGTLNPPYSSAKK